MSKITIDRAVLEQALETLSIQHVESFMSKRVQAITALRAALEQPQDHFPNAGNSVPTGWKLVPVEPTSEMIAAGKESMQYSIAELPAFTCYNAMLRAAPQPPVVKESLTVGQQPPRQPLTDDEIEKLFPYTHEWLYEIGLEEATKFARSIEAAHGIGGEK